MKKGELRRERIIDAGQELFFQKGYAETGIQDILDALSLSKGGFYHHFESKESLLAAVCDRRLDQRLRRSVAEIRASRRDVCERMNRLLSVASLFEQEETGFLRMLMRLSTAQEDVMIRDRLRRVTLAALLPLADELIELGIGQRKFHTRYPASTGRLILLMEMQLDQEMMEILSDVNFTGEDVANLVEMVDAYRSAVEMMLGAPYSSMRLMNVDHVLDACRQARGTDEIWEEIRE